MGKSKERKSWNEGQDREGKQVVLTFACSRSERSTAQFYKFNLYFADSFECC